MKRGEKLEIVAAKNSTTKINKERYGGTSLVVIGMIEKRVTIAEATIHVSKQTKQLQQHDVVTDYVLEDIFFGNSIFFFTVWITV